MPNWCENYLTVSGEPEEIKRFIDANMGLPAQYPPVYLDDGTCISKPQNNIQKYFCFNAMIPTPQEVLEIGFDGQGKIPEIDLAEFYSGKIPKVLDGYHWNLVHWGTKWDIYADKITHEDLGWTEDCDYIDVLFDTAWSPPIPWFETIVSAFPKLKLKLHYEEGGNYFAGDIFGENGVCTYDEYDEDRCDEIFQYDEEDE